VLVFAWQLSTGRLKLLSVPVHCLGAKSNRNSTNMVPFSESFLVTLLKPGYKIAGSLSDSSDIEENHEHGSDFLFQYTSLLCS
jgi:hypothetical protein